MRGTAASLSAMSRGSFKSSKSHRSSSHDGAASRNNPATGFSTSSSDKYFSRRAPPTECPTNTAFARSRDNSAEIFRFQAFTFGSASSGIRGKCTSYSPPSACPRDAASGASSSYAPLPPPCTNSTSVLAICVSQPVRSSRLPDAAWLLNCLNRAVVLGPFVAVGSKRDELAGLQIHCCRQCVAIRPHVRADVTVVAQLLQL